jgi:uncharacterized protein DUF6484
VKSPSELLAETQVGTSLVESRTGRVVRLSPAGAFVLVPGITPEPTLARRVRSVSEEDLRGALAQGEPVLLAFEGGDPSRPVIRGIVTTESATPNLDHLLAPSVRLPAEVRVDGARVVIEGEQEVVLNCGKASITLRRDGKVVVRGTEIVTQADGRLRLRGGKVEVN